MPRVSSGHVADRSVPIPHFGAVLDMLTWRALAARLDAAHVRFLVDPEIRFSGMPGEQGTFFLRDPSGNALEFKGYQTEQDMFATLSESVDR